MHRHWLDWQRPMVPAAATWLIEQHVQSGGQAPSGAGGRCDLRGVRVVVPGSRAGRLLLKALVDHCIATRVRLVPPQILTPGSMVDSLLPPTADTASPLECSLAWMHVLREANPRAISPVLPRPPEYYDWPAWHEIAVTLRDVSDDLASELLTFGDVAKCAIRLHMDREATRWEVLQELYQRYLERLAACQRVEPHARCQAALEELEPDDGESLVLVGVVELGRLQRKVVSAFGDRCTALIHGCAEVEEGFDDHGCVVPEFWRARRINVPDNEIVIGDRASDQAQAVMEILAGFAGKFRPEEVSVGLGDESLASVLTRAGEWEDLVFHDPRGRSVFKSRPYRLLAAGSDWLREPRFHNFASLVRQPDVEKWVRITVAREEKAKKAKESGEQTDGEEVVETPSPAVAENEVEARPSTAEDGDTPHEGLPPAGPSQGDVKAPREWLTLLDRYYAEHLDDLQDGRWLGAGSVRHRLSQLLRAVQNLFEPLLPGSRAGRGEQQRDRRPLLEWFEPILDVLRNAFGEIATATNNLSDARAAAACLEVSRALGTFSGAAPELQPEVDCTTALRMVLTYAGGLRTPDEPRNGQVEMLGWLELHLDTAPALIVVGVNDGAIPQAVTADPFLPDLLRSALGVLCNRRRYARDAYLLEAIRASRQHCTFIAGRTTADGEPLTPSRLLLAGDRETLPRRVLRLCDASKSRRWPLPRGAPPSGSKSGFAIPVPDGEVPDISVMAVTEFSWYLRCPYRYWLKYIKRLKPIDDSAVELDAMQFGILGHEVLQIFGQDEQIADGTDAKVIANFLDETLDSVARDRFGSNPLPAIRIQLARMRARLHAFARLQSRRRRDGWKIEYCEYTFPEETFLEVPGQDKMRIRGTIDRLDRNIRDGTWMIIDYKTGESGRDPERTHRKRVPGTGDRVWSDLQLPLYQHLAVQHGISGRVQLAYINLPKKPENVGLAVAKWGPAELGEAVETAQGIVRNVRAGKFEMAEDFPGHFQDDFANICQTGVFGGGEDGGLEAEA